MGGDEFEEREAASEALGRRGEQALPALRKALMDKDAEVRRRAKELVRSILYAARVRDRDKLRLAFAVIGARVSVETGPAGPEVVLDFSGSKVTDRDLLRLKGHATFQVLKLSGTAITYRGLEHLESRGELRVLHLPQSAITPEGTRILGRHKKLAQLILDFDLPGHVYDALLTALPNTSIQEKTERRQTGFAQPPLVTAP
jgi:hypothetical protein